MNAKKVNVIRETGCILLSGLLRLQSKYEFVGKFNEVVELAEVSIK